METRVTKCRCGQPMHLRGRKYAEDCPEADSWTEKHGYVQILYLFCKKCDPNLIDVQPTHRS